EQRWIDDWTKLAARYEGLPNSPVIGAELHNAPGGAAGEIAACWRAHAADPECERSRNWRRAARVAGNAILAVAPSWLILVDGVEFSNNLLQADPYWPGGNLIAVKKFPVILATPNHVVYVAQDYSVDVAERCWLNGDEPCTEPTENYPLNL